jgi:hypothetical protein
MALKPNDVWAYCNLNRKCDAYWNHNLCLQKQENCDCQKLLSKEELNAQKNGCTFYTICGNSQSLMCTNKACRDSFKECGVYKKKSEASA